MDTLPSEIKKFDLLFHVSEDLLPDFVLLQKAVNLQMRRFVRNMLITENTM